MAAPVMPIITGIRCVVLEAKGGIGDAPVGVGVGDYIDGDGRAVVVTITDDSGQRRAAIMHIDKAEAFAGLIAASVKRSRRALRRMKP